MVAELLYPVLNKMFEGREEEVDLLRRRLAPLHQALEKTRVAGLVTRLQSLLDSDWLALELETLHARRARHNAKKGRPAGYDLYSYDRFDDSENESSEDDGPMYCAPEGAEPPGAEPKAGEPPGVEPKAGESEGVESEGVESDGGEPEGVESESVESEGGESEDDEFEGAQDAYLYENLQYEPSMLAELVGLISLYEKRKDAEFFMQVHIQEPVRRPEVVKA